MKKVIKILLICICFLTTILVTYSYAATGTVTANRVRLRKENNTNSDIIVNIKKDEKVEIIDEKENWYNVKYKSFTGFVSKDYVQLDEENISNLNETASEILKEQEHEEKQEEPKQEESIIGKEYKIVKDTNLRLSPNFSSIKIENITKDTLVKVSKQLGNWIEISVNNKTGWICKNRINLNTVPKEEEVAPPEEEQKPAEVEKPEEQETPKPAQTPNTPEVKKGYINVDTANVRDGASTTAKRLGFLDLNDEIEILAEDGDWYKINTKEYGECYIAKRLVSFTKVTSRQLEEQRDSVVSEEKNDQLNNILGQTATNSSEKGIQIAEFAKQYLGYKYVSGGKKPETGFDCSGFTRYVFSNFGVSLGATAASQANNSGVEVSRDSLQIGDLILFQDDGRTRIGHCGIYIGDNTFIHAANPKRGVVTDKLEGNSYYSPRYVSAYRF